MSDGLTVTVIIPALNEAAAIGKVLADIPAWVDEIVVVDNGSTDGTGAVASAAGARVVAEPRRGYGRACLAGLAATTACDVVVFLDGDYSDYPQEMDRLVRPIALGRTDLVIGSRTRGRHPAGCFTLPQRFGNVLACFLVCLIWRFRYTDLGPFRAIRWSSLRALRMQDTTYGWTVEMQIKALTAGLTVVEVPVSYRARIGRSKISGTVRGVVSAGAKIIGTILRAAIGRLPTAPPAVSNRHVIVFTRYPEPGRTKTRLIPALGAVGAADLQRRMTERTVARVRRLAQDRVSWEVRFEGGDADAVGRWLGDDVPRRQQGPGDLGERMARALRSSFEAGAKRVLVIGTDCPGLTPAIMRAAFSRLRHADVVLGPATDGGYYLIGLRRPAPGLFDGIQWGTEHVLSAALSRAEAARLTTGFLPPLRDVDRPEDLPAWNRRGRADQPPHPPALSVVIPALNEVSHLRATLETVPRGPDVEIIVVDGSSTDGTREIGRSFGARVVRCGPHRARQMNAGAGVARGEVLLFLHADTRLPDDCADRIRAVLAQPGVVAGAFKFRLDRRTPALRVIERLTNWRARRLQMPYGDQGLFLRARDFHRAGGFPDLPIMDDFEFVRRLRRLGRIAIVPAAAVTSARRWMTLGVWRTSLVNQGVIAGRLFGVPPATLARWYASGSIIPHVLAVDRRPFVGTRT